MLARAAAHGRPHEGFDFDRFALLQIDDALAMTHRYELEVRRPLTPEGVGFEKRQTRVAVVRQRGRRKDFYLDLLFYHLKLRCFVVVELKTVPFDRCGTSPREEIQYLGRSGNWNKAKLATRRARAFSCHRTRRQWLSPPQRQYP